MTDTYSQIGSVQRAILRCRSYFAAKPRRSVMMASTGTQGDAALQAPLVAALPDVLRGVLWLIAAVAVALTNLLFSASSGEPVLVQVGPFEITARG